MKPARARLVAGVSLLCLGALLSACTTQQPASSTATSPPASTASICPDIQAVQSNPAAAAPLDQQDPHSALGVLWADAKSACANGLPAPGVSTDWGALVWGEVKALAPTVLPLLIGLI